MIELLEKIRSIVDACNKGVITPTAAIYKINQAFEEDEGSKTN